MTLHGSVFDPAGATFFGLCCMLTGCETFDDALQASIK